MKADAWADLLDKCACPVCGSESCEDPAHVGPPDVPSE